MGGAHGHGHAVGDGGTRHRVRLPRPVTVTLIVIVALLALGTVGAAAAMWPTTVRSTTSPTQLPVQDQVEAQVRSVEVTTCSGLSEDRNPDGSIPAEVRCGVATVRLEAGPQHGRTVRVQVDAITLGQGLTAGSQVHVVAIPDPGDGSSNSGADGSRPAAGTASGEVWVFVDFDRTFPLQLLALVFGVLVVGLARLRGLAALAGLVLGYLAVLRFILPAIRNGHDPTTVALVGCVGVMIVLLYLSHGVSAKTTSALLGTVLGLGITAVLAHWAVGAAHLTGLTGDDALTLTRLVGQQTLSGVILAGVILAGVGVLNDVTVTQASAIWELREHAPHLGPVRLFASGMRIGRDHLASTVYTIAFVYAGSALPTLLLISLYGQPLGQVLTSAGIAEELVRTLVGGIGLVLAIPMTTGIAALIASRGAVEDVGAHTPRDGGEPREPASRHAAAGSSATWGAPGRHEW